MIPRVVYSFSPGWLQHITTTAMKNWLQQWRELQRSEIPWHFSELCFSMCNHWFFVERGVQLVYDTVGGVELGRNSLKCLQFGGRLTILAERLFNSVLPDTVICNLCLDLTVKDQVYSQVLHRGLDLDTNGRRWSRGWGRPCHCQHSSHQSYHDESRPLQSWFVFCIFFSSYSGCSSSGVSSGYPYTPAAQHKRGKVRSLFLVLIFLKHVKRSFWALLLIIWPSLYF